LAPATLYVPETLVVPEERFFWPVAADPPENVRLAKLASGMDWVPVAALKTNVPLMDAP
jgi:hypothetical protein